MLLQIEERELEPDITVLELKGRLALGRESQRVEALAEELIKERRLKTILDLTGVDYIDSAGIGILALVAGRMKSAGGALAVVAPEGKVRQMLTMTQMVRILSVRSTVGDAVTTFGETLPPAAA